MAVSARILADGKRLHLNHGPIDLIIEADGGPREVKRAYDVARIRFSTVNCLCCELTCQNPD
jgi:uncharacterized protein